MIKETDNTILDRAQQWLGDAFDAETRNMVKDLINNKPEELADAFYRDLEFGTGGLRGIMGVGTNRMNKYTVGMATQGLANYILKSFPGLDRPKVAIAHDCRNNSEYFTDITAEVLSANGIGVYVFDALRPTPLLSFAVRELNCQAGIVITASHNPAEYNGYKVYWDDGGQLVPPHDKNVIAEVQKTHVDQILFGKVERLITQLDKAFDAIYINKLKTLSLAPDLIEKHSDLRIVFTPIHGTTVRIVPEAFKAFGFKKVFNVPEQDVVDGNFPTVQSPNPEEPAAFEMALDRAKVVDADLVMATDPDGDRLGVAVKDRSGNYVLINGNQCAAILTYYVLEQWKKKGKLRGDEYIVKTVVTTELLAEMAASYHVECYDVLTGFKYIAEKMRLLEGEKRFLCGGEESYGFTVGDYVRDKDAVVSCCMVAEAAAWAREQGLTLLDLLVTIYLKYGLFVESLTSITKKGQEGAKEISRMMDTFRNEPPASIDGKTIARIIDFQSGVDKDIYLNEEYPVDLPKSNVLQFVLEDGTRITMRPSGTEPKIKFYFGCRSKLDHAQDYEEKRTLLLRSVENIKKELGV
jgi:phosphoglucomutase